MATKEVSCYDIGFNFGLCSVLSFHEKECPEGTDVVVPKHCRNLDETHKGIKEGVKEAFAILGLTEKGEQING